jgi:hypothetical protein
MTTLANELQQLMARARAEYEQCDLRVYAAVSKFAHAQDGARLDLARDMQAIFAPQAPPPVPLRAPDNMGLDQVDREWAQYRSEAGE